MKAFLILEDGTVFEGTSIGSTREVISEIVFNTSMTGYLEVLTDPSYAGQAVVHDVSSDRKLRDLPGGLWSPKDRGRTDILSGSFPECPATSAARRAFRIS